MSEEAPRVRVRARVQGTVQGVGFRPFVYRLAGEEGLAGFVLNDEHGVVIELEGSAPVVARFQDRLVGEAPPLAMIDRVQYTEIAVQGTDDGFQILASRRAGPPDASVTPDSTTCPDCLAELGSASDRRYRYPFINCTNCGPRFTIVTGIPYDRPLTTMAGFEMCAECRREYEDPADRRFHAQPNACPRCGPSVRVLDPTGIPVGTDDPIGLVAARLAAGAVAAIKGLGGFHLACDAASEDAVAALRARKHREDKPFALMVADVAAARAFAAIGAQEEALLSSVQRPIVLAVRRDDAPVAAAVAPGAPELGLMLPYTPLHSLLLEAFGAAGGGAALVMTSGNRSDDPIAYDDADAVGRLGPIADLFLVHDREIATRTDDSVVRAVDGGDGVRRPLLLRRSRGYVPAPLPLLTPAERPLLACGAEQKSTFCVAKGSRAWVSHHIGDLEHVAAFDAFRSGVRHFERLFAVSPEVVVHDMHPDYLSTAFALAREDVELLAVQHHHAHLASCLAEHGLTGPAVGAIYDGTGYGTDGTVWGGELLIGGLTEFERAGWLRPLRMPGAAAAIRQPWRMAFAWLAESFGEPQTPPPPLAALVRPDRWTAMGQVASNASVSPLTSSMGRLFDAVGALCGVAVEVSYEGQAAVELEAAAWTAGACGAYPFGLDNGEIDPRPAVLEAALDLDRGAAPAVVAARFHAGVAAVTVRAVVDLAGSRGLECAVLSGGVFQNRLLLETVSAGLTRSGLRVLVPERLPPNDGGISYGQAAIAAAAQALPR